MTLPGLRDGIDEMVDGSRQLRPHWRGVLGGLSMLSDNLTNRQRRLDQAFEDDGVRSILPGAPLDGRGEGNGLWHCDPIPLPISAREFAELEVALAQRAALFEALLEDLYGAQEVYGPRASAAGAGVQQSGFPARLPHSARGSPPEAEFFRGGSCPHVGGAMACPERPHLRRGGRRHGTGKPPHPLPRRA